ncbi:MAG TPA: extracellular solute-binding protein [Candidatus Acidoferrales bacterium]|nr:extracellular solute-binding protein [Candidatus Acidoferrales bacterium]
MKAFLSALTWWILAGPSLLGAAAGPSAPAPLKAQKEAEARGYIFVASRDEILARAKAEGKVRALTSLAPPTIRAMTAAFRKKYPFLDLYVEELDGQDAAQRFLLELKGGVAKGWDVAQFAADYFNDFVPFALKVDILGMAAEKILAIEEKMIDPHNRSIVALAADAGVVPYNKNLIAAEKVPDRWEDFLKPEFKGRKFIVDVRPKTQSDLVPALGLERVLDYCKKLAAQEPIWVRGGTRILTSMAAGEYALHAGIDLNAVVRVMKKDPTGSLAYKAIEPVPLRIKETQGVLKGANSPHAALLWLEFQASAEGQAIIDEHEPISASFYTPGSALEKLLRGKKFSLVDWQQQHLKQLWMAKIVEAFAFPKAERK